MNVLSSDGLRVKNSGIAIDNQDGNIYVDNVDNNPAVFSESKNLDLSIASVETVDADADKLTLLDSDSKSILIENFNETFDITAHIQGTEKSSTDYQLWVSCNNSKDITLKMAPDITCIKDVTTAFKLEDSTADFVDDDIQVGDIIKNTTDDTETTVTNRDDLNTLSVADDIFVSGENYEINIVSPVGLTRFKINIGKAFNNSSGDIDDTEINNDVIKKPNPRITTAFWHTINGYGSSSNKIQKFVTEVDSSDDIVVTVDNSATLGFTITANMDCILHVVYGTTFNAAGYMGLTKNSTQLTTAIHVITTDKMVLNNTKAGNLPTACNFSGALEAGDVIRPHTDGSGDGSSPIFGSISVLAIERL